MRRALTVGRQARTLDEAGVRTLCHLVAGDPVLADGRGDGTRDTTD